MDATVLMASELPSALRYIPSVYASRNRNFDWQTALEISAQTVKGVLPNVNEEQVHPEY
jgi:pyrroline-5-carboxylate reductase